MLGKVSVQPSVGHWKVLPEQRNKAEIQQQPGCAAPPWGWGQPHQWVSSTSHALPTPIRCCAASPRGTGTVTSAASALSPALPPPNQKRALWSEAGCPSLTLEGLRGSVVDLQVVHQLLHAGEGQFAAVARALVVLAWKETDPLASSLPLLLSLGQGWGSAHLGQVCASAAAGPGLRSLRSLPPASGRRAEPLRCNLPQAETSLSPCLNHLPLCPPSYPL